jgi:hypothetical protein
VTRRVPARAEDHGGAMQPDRASGASSRCDVRGAVHGKTAYVTDVRSGTVTPISIATNTPGKPLKVGAAYFITVVIVP